VWWMGRVNSSILTKKVTAYFDIAFISGEGGCY